MCILISWLLIMKSGDQDLHCFQYNGIKFGGKMYNAMQSASVLITVNQ